MYDLQKELLNLLGEDGYLSLIEAYGGLRLYVPANYAQTKLEDRLDKKYVKKLSEFYRGDTICVPLDRHYRISRYRLRGMTIRTIARKLCMTESGVEKALSKMSQKNKRRLIG